MTPKMAKKIGTLERELRDAIFLKDREKVTDCVNDLFQHGYSREEKIMRDARNFLRLSHASRN